LQQASSCEYVKTFIVKSDKWDCLKQLLKTQLITIIGVLSLFSVPLAIAVTQQDTANMTTTTHAINETGRMTGNQTGGIGVSVGVIVQINVGIGIGGGNETQQNALEDALEELIKERLLSGLVGGGSQSQ
jgi:hypothetical protein